MADVRLWAPAIFVLICYLGLVKDFIKTSLGKYIYIKIHYPAALKFNIYRNIVFF